MNNIYYTLLSHVSQFGLQGVLTSVLISSTNNSNEVVDAFAFINTPPPHTHTKNAQGQKLQFNVSTCSLTNKNEMSCK